jgi:hypothetical protein
MNSPPNFKNAYCNPLDIFCSVIGRFVSAPRCMQKPEFQSLNLAGCRRSGLNLGTETPATGQIRLECVLCKYMSQTVFYIFISWSQAASRNRFQG